MNKRFLQKLFFSFLACFIFVLFSCENAVDTTYDSLIEESESDEEMSTIRERIGRQYRAEKRKAREERGE